MTASTITPARVRDLAIMAQVAAESLRRLAVSISAGEVTPAEAAAEVAETIQNLTNASK